MTPWKHIFKKHAQLLRNQHASVFAHTPRSPPTQAQVQGFRIPRRDAALARLTPWCFQVSNLIYENI